MNITTIYESPSAEPAPTRSSRPAIDRTEILLVADDRRKAEAEVLGLCGQGSVDEIFIARGSAEALDLLCRLREYEYRRNGRDLRVIMMNPRSRWEDLDALADRLYGSGSKAHFPIVRFVNDAGAGSFETVHYHQFEDLLDSTRACCVLLWESCRIAA